MNKSIQMTNAAQLARRFKEVILDGTWIANTNYKHQLSDTTWLEATMRIGSLNTLAALTFHINYYIAGILEVFEGGELTIQDKYSFEAPSINSQEEWNLQLNDLWTNAEKFAQYVESMSDSKLKESFVKDEYGSNQRNIEGVIEHSYYHLGQVSLIKKMVRS